MDLTYPQGPASVPPTLTRPTSRYRTHAWLAVAGLVSFVALYFALAGWFAWTAWRLLSGALVGGDDALWLFVGGFCAAFLAVFMLKALFFVQHRYEIEDIEVTAEEQPRLFAFLHRLADEAGAPRPHRVFLSPRVNAAVFYDLSVLNLVIPSKKNLEIGLPLVNALTLAELKAVLAHEFGHFAQRSMAVGRWVYIAQQIAAQIIARRDALDSFLGWLSRIDLRVAWIGWLLSLTVWAIRSVTETFFKLVLLAQRALSREMEFQADLVAVSLTGSDALMHALYKLGPADNAWDRAFGFAAAEARDERPVRDLFALQAHITQRMRGILNDPRYGEAPPPSERPESHRLFQAGLAQAPRMWSTHPSNAEREENAKRIYVPAPTDDRSAWEVFDDVEALKERMSAHVFPDATATPAPIEASRQRLDAQFDRAYLDPRYRGAYLGRSIVRHAKAPTELYDRSLDPVRAAAELQSLYPSSLGDDLARLRELEEERGALLALRDGFLQAPGGVIRHRGRELKRRDLPHVIEKLDEELGAVRDKVCEHDRLCRTVHLAAAAQLGGGWSAYLAGLLAVVHYADHAEADVLDAHGAFANVWSVVTADGRVTNRELKRLIEAGAKLHEVLARVHGEAEQVALDRTLLDRMEVESWPAALGELKLPPPTKDNIGDWLNAVDGWVRAAAGALSALNRAALDQLLLSELETAQHVREGTSAGAGPEPSRVPADYPVLLPGTERARQKRLGLWDRFQLADGPWATAARLAVAAGIVGAVMSVGGTIDQSDLDIYNGLDRRVQVTVAGTSVQIGPRSAARMALPRLERAAVSAATLDGRPVERFETELERRYAHYVYNVAAAAPLVEWTATYGSASGRPDRPLGTVRWSTTAADHVFEEPPESIDTSGSGGTLRVVTALGDAPPATMLSYAGTDEERTRLIGAHARWDGADSRYLETWLGLASEQPGFAALLQARLEADPRDVMAMRAEQNYAPAEQRAAVCARHAALARTAPDDADLLYIAARCIDDPAARDEAFLEGFRAHPDSGWLAYAVGYGYAARARWSDAVAPFETARRRVSGLAENAALDLARLRRMLDGESAVLDDLARDSTALQYFLHVEAGADLLPGTAQAYHHLHRGELEEAVAAVDGLPEAARVLKLAAASDGAPADLIAAALALPAAERPDAGAAFAMAGLALREGRSPDAWLAVVGEIMPGDAEPLARFASAVRAGTDPEAAERLLDGVNMTLRAHAYAMATVALGERAPQRWRDGVRRLLFAPERPFLIEL